MDFKPVSCVFWGEYLSKDGLNKLKRAVLLLISSIDFYCFPRNLRILGNTAAVHMKMQNNNKWKS